MLEVKNLIKTYRTKNGVVTNALDGVSLTFAETGMVFILGKSGSGKSTLLNVCGGLDKPDSGEIIIKGKSSKDFSTQDFDSYRNTYVGFVFQEYNVLNEFSVEENIAIALELQNKKRDKAAIDAILDEVEMKAFALRKPNTLSGGQKQRVAIARALVKSPEIIMADEPTGALDSATGQQVFDTLKKLSQTKLVLVVSHDRDFAEQYGDRIIELKDGKIISDQVRFERNADEQNVRFFGTNTVSVSDGSKLTDDDMSKIKNFLQKSGGAAVISTSREQITEMKKDLPELSTGEFSEIKEQPQSKRYEPQALIRSHLPIKHAIRMGASSLKTKPVRLVFTVLLSIMAFVIFGMSSTLMLFDEKSVTVRTLADEDYDYIILNKVYWTKANSYYGDELRYTEEYTVNTEYTYDEFISYRERFPGTLASVDVHVSVSNITLDEYAEQFYTSNINGFILADPSLSVIDGGGRLPTAADEVAIPSFLYDALRTEDSSITVTNSLGDPVELSDINKPSDLLYSEDNPVALSLGGSQPFKVVGIYKSPDVPLAYAELKDAADNHRKYYDNGMTGYMWYSARESGLYARLAVTEELIKQFDMSIDDNDRLNERDFFNPTDSVCMFDALNFSLFVPYIARYAEDTELKLLPLYNLDGEQIQSLEPNGVAISGLNYAQELYEQLNEQYKKKYGDKYEEEKRDIIIRADESQTDGDGETEAGAQEKAVIDSLFQALYDGVFTKERLLPAIVGANDLAEEWGLSIEYKLYSDYADSSEVRVNGLFFVNRGFNNCAYLSDDLYETYYVKDPWHTEYETEYTESENAYIGSLFIPYGGSRLVAENLVDLTYTRNADDSSAKIANPVMTTLQIVFLVVDVLWKVFLVIGIILALFALLLMFNFISASISAKKKEIGILRAIGARTVDVFKIFLSEALIISVTCFAVACLFTAADCGIINLIMRTQTIINVSMFVFGPLSVLCVFGIAVLTSVIATVIPVAIYSKKPPVDSIRSL